MSLKSNLIKAGALGAVITALTIGAASAAVATASVNVRSGPSTSYRVLDTLQRGDHVDVSRQSGGWCRIDGGWVSCAYLTSSNDREQPFYDDRDNGPDVSFSFGFGTPYPRYPHHHRMHPGPFYPGPHWW